MAMEGARGVLVVESLRDAFRWVEHCLSALPWQSALHPNDPARSSVSEPGSQPERMRDLMRVMAQTTTSSAFSGVGCPENATSFIARGVAVATGSDVHEVQPKPLWACEWSPESQCELKMMQPEAPACIFGDITDLVKPNAFF